MFDFFSKSAAAFDWSEFRKTFETLNKPRNVWRQETYTFPDAKSLQLYQDEYSKTPRLCVDEEAGSLPYYTGTSPKSLDEPYVYFVNLPGFSKDQVKVTKTREGAETVLEIYAYKNESKHEGSKTVNGKLTFEDFVVKKLECSFENGQLRVLAWPEAKAAPETLEVK